MLTVPHHAERLNRRAPFGLSPWRSGNLVEEGQEKIVGSRDGRGHQENMTPESTKHYSYELK